MVQNLRVKITSTVLRFLFGVNIKGLENLNPTERQVVMANQVSSIDGILVSHFVPGQVVVAMTSAMNTKLWARLLYGNAYRVQFDPSDPASLRKLADHVEAGKTLVIFPERRPTITGGLMKIHEAAAQVASIAKAKIVPLRIDGPQFSRFSFMQEIVRPRLFPRVKLTFTSPSELTSPPEKQGGDLRSWHGEQLYTAMSGMMFKTSHIDRSMWQTLLDAAATHGKNRVILEDIQRTPISYSRLIMGSLVLGRKLAGLTHLQKNVGVLLPNSQAIVMTFFGLVAHGQVPAMLNFTSGLHNMLAACMAAQVRTIITSRKFIAAAELQAIVDGLSQDCKIIYLEDVRNAIKLPDKLFGLFGKYFPRAATPRATKDPHSPAVILFTSGSEGVPKGVVLSHRNLNSNWLQGAARVDFNAKDIVFNTLPAFHAFGLLGGVLLPILGGLRSFQYPSPLHYKMIPELCYEIDATVLFGTDTFLSGYAKSANAFDFHKMRIVVAGAERLKPETSALWLEKFGLRILEGYGVTECSPAVAINTPMHYKLGTVGQLFDEMTARIEPVQGIESGGRLFVKGPNVMLGYLRADNPGVIEPPRDGWHDTGDIVHIDDLGFITIAGRVKRFAKIAGEMISLTAVETTLQQAFVDVPQAVVAVPDQKKGEQIILFTTLEKLDRKTLAERMKNSGATDLMIPKAIIAVQGLPLLGSGKVDYVSLNRLAMQKLEA